MVFTFEVFNGIFMVWILWPWIFKTRLTLSIYPFLKTGTVSLCLQLSLCMSIGLSNFLFRNFNLF